MQIELALASDAVWAEIGRRGRCQLNKLSESETYRYDLYVMQQLKLWEQAIGRYEQSLMPPDRSQGRDEYYE